MATNVFNPRVEGKQNSGCRIKIQKGSDIIQVGWRVSLINSFSTLLIVS